METFEKNYLLSFSSSLHCDPRFKTRCCTSDNKEKKIKLLLKEEITNAVASDQATENPSLDHENKEPPPKKAKSQLFSFMEDEDDDAVNVTGKSIVDNEIDCYLKEPCKKIHVDPLRFWELRKH